ncbi:hypothetical protein [Limnobacter sp.]|uniref:hypothetical protein n=1 Tax=Limnobacter sp. TaxID=2003368 RepID=UPI003516F727
MTLWRLALAALVVLNLALLAYQSLGPSPQEKRMLEPGFRADWVEVQRPWLEPAATAQALVASSVAPKIDLQAGQAQLELAIENASNGSLGNRPVDLECRLWGPFLPGDQVRIEEALKPWGGQVTRTERQVPVGYVVYLPKAAVDSGQGMGQLAGKGITDAFYMNTPGPMQGTISLGLFREKLRAVQHRNELLAKGVEGVDIRERLGPVRVYFELRGSPAQAAELQQIYALNAKAELVNCPASQTPS